MHPYLFLLSTWGGDEDQHTYVSRGKDKRVLEDKILCFVLYIHCTST